MYEEDLKNIINQYDLIDVYRLYSTMAEYTFVVHTECSVR